MTYNKKSVEDIEVNGKKVIVRCDFNVPQDENLNITDDKRITASLPTIKYLLENGASVILCSHLGRPKGEFNPKFSLAPVAKRLSELLNIEVKFATDVIGDDAKEKASSLKTGEVLLLENVRFHAEEDGKDEVAKEEYARKLSSYAEIFVNDAFGTAHRSHASTAVIAKFLPAVCGKLIQKELDFMGGALDNPKRPFVSVLGGSKVSDKIGVITNLIEKCDTIIIGGAMAYTFAKATGANIGKSMCELDKLDLANSIIEKAKAKGVKLLLPVDSACADGFADVTPTMAQTNDIPDELMGLDIGEKAILEYQNAVANAGTVIWNGPMGVFEFENFSAGTKGVASAIADSNAVSIIGGGDSAAAVEIFGYADKMSHISTGGGASLEFLEGLVLPGIACLQDK